MLRVNKRYLLHELSLAVLAFCMWMLLFDLLRFVLVYELYLIERISTIFITLVLLFFIAITTQFHSFTYNKIRMLACFSIFFLLISSGVHWHYTSYQSYKKTIPNIRSLSKNWAIQGDVIVIKGRHFGHSWESGSVSAGATEFIIREWTDTQIVAELPVPETFSEAHIVVTNHYGNTSQHQETFFIRNPVDVL